MAKQLVDIKSQPAFLTELSVFGVPGTTLEVERMKAVKYLPLSSLRGADSIEFYMSPTDDYIDITKTQLDLWIQITDSDGNRIRDKLANVAPICGIGSTLFQRLDIYAGDVLIESTGPLKAFSDYLQVLGSYDRNALLTQFVPGLFFLDKEYQFDNMNVVGDDKSTEDKTVEISNKTPPARVVTEAEEEMQGDQPAVSRSSRRVRQTEGQGGGSGAGGSGSGGGSGEGTENAEDKTDDAAAGSGNQPPAGSGNQPPAGSGNQPVARAGGTDTATPETKVTFSIESLSRALDRVYAQHYQANEVNPSWKTKRDMFSLSRIVHTSVPLMTAITNQQRFLPGRLPLRFRFIKNDNAFALMYPEADKDKNYKLEILRAELKIYKAVINSEKLLAMESHMQKNNPWVIPLQRMQNTYHVIPSGVSDYSFPNLCIGTLPVRAFYCFVTNQAFTGKCHLNPFDFGNFNLQSMSASINGDPVIESPIQLNYKAADFVEGYISFLNGTGIRRKNISRQVTLGNFAGGYAIYGMDYSNDLRSSSGLIYSPVNTGVLKLDLKWQDTLQEPLVMICKFIYDSQLNINSDRSLVFDYTA
jgi:hypothetical protein